MLTTVLLTLIGLIMLAVVWLARRNPILLRMALRNLARRKGYAVIVVCGLTIGTAMIASALIYQDTQEYYLVKDTYNRLGLVDEMVSRSGKTGLYLPFPYAVYEELAEQVADDGRIYAISPGLVNPYVRVKDERSGIYKDRATLFGMDFGLDRPFGPFTTPDGQEVYGEDLGPGEAIITQGLADALKAEVGDRLIIYPKGQVEVKQIVSNEGKATLFFSANIFVTLETAQRLAGAPGQINWMKISNTGTAENEAAHSDGVKATVEKVLGDEFQVSTIKKDLLESVRSRARFMGLLFLGLSVFTIVAGLLLIVNLMVTLAEERRAEMGMARAVGMKRRHLVGRHPGQCRAGPDGRPLSFGSGDSARGETTGGLHPGGGLYAGLALQSVLRNLCKFRHGLNCGSVPASMRSTAQRPVLSEAEELALGEAEGL